MQKAQYSEGSIFINICLEGLLYSKGPVLRISFVEKL